MKEILQKLIRQEQLSRQEAKNVLLDIGRGKYEQIQTAAFLTAFMMRTVSGEELYGFREAMLELSLKVDLSEFNSIDLCGTGGDGKNSFNISTLASFVVAGAGEKVSKHGNYGVSSASGSSNMLEYFGYKFSNDADKLKTELEKTGFCFLHAPFFHPAMKNIAPVRKALGMRTFFNILGPMINPSSPNSQIVGVFDDQTAKLYQYIYNQLDINFKILYSLDGYDEISLTDNFKVITNNGESIMKPEEIGFETVLPSYIYGGKDVEESAKIFINILKGDGIEAQNNVVIANAGMALSCIHPGKGIAECMDDACKSLKDKNALLSFNTLMEMNS